ncbi:MAG TPA: DUF1963 domain-containing protein [Microvirga sp.]|nr:DUF1963 domain-containing protein [Microvirga sp.]
MFGRRLAFMRPRTAAQPQPNAIFLKKRWPYRAADLGASSHLGGDPMLPDGEPWPACPRSGGPEPLHFLAQIDCGALPDVEGRHLLPGRGLLSFFLLIWDGLGSDEDRDPISWAVRHFDRSGGRLARRPPPADLKSIDERAERFSHRGLPFDIPEDSKRFGFVPVSPLPLVTMRDPASESDDPASSPPDLREHYDLSARAALRAALGPEPPTPPLITRDEAWPETVLHARFWIETALPAAKRAAEQAGEFLAHWDAGKRRDHPFYAKDERWQRESDAEREIVAERWRTGLRDKLMLVETLEQVSPDLAGLPAGSPVPEAARRALRAVQPIMTYDPECGENDARRASLTLLRRYPADELPLGPASLAWARATTATSNYSANYLLGCPQEVQSVSPRRAWRRMEALGWAPRGSSAQDVRLLAQFDTCYSGAGFLFADCGKAYFYALEQDLAARRFDRTVVIVDGG